MAGFGRKTRYWKILDRTKGSVMMSKSSVILTVGLPYSGKSTWARKQGGVSIVSPDAIRLAMHGQRYVESAEPLVWATAMIMAKALVFAGNYIIIVDATNTTKKRRDFWRSDDWDLSYHTMEVSREECIRRAKVAKDVAILPVIARMSEKFEQLDAEESPWETS